jgi:hypothetical protein
MSRTLGRIAFFGLGIGIVSLVLAYALGGRDAYRVFDHGVFAAHGCGGDGAGSGERRLVWTGGDSIDITLPARVHLRGGEGNDILLRGAPDVIGHIELRGSRLLLDCRSGSSPSIDITLPGKAFRRISIAGAARLDMENLDQPELAINISGSGSVRGQGSVDRLSIKVSGSGDARLADLAMKQLTLKISGSGNVEAGPRDEADISISGSGNIRLLSRPPNLHTHISGSGRITQVADSTDTKK